MLNTLRQALSPTDPGHLIGKSWGDRFTGVQHLRAHTALGVLEHAVDRATDEETAVRTAKLLLRGVGRSTWAD